MESFEKFPQPPLEGSGQRAMAELEKALADARQKMEELRQRSERGEEVNDQEVRRLHERIQELKKAKSDILAGGM